MYNCFICGKTFIKKTTLHYHCNMAHPATKYRSETDNSKIIDSLASGSSANTVPLKILMDQYSLGSSDLTQNGHIMMLTRSPYFTKESIDHTIQTLAETQIILTTKLKALRPAFRQIIDDSNDQEAAILTDFVKLSNAELIIEMKKHETRVEFLRFLKQSRLVTSSSTSIDFVTTHRKRFIDPHMLVVDDDITDVDEMIKRRRLDIQK
jgi:hypothetical protein